MFCEQCSQPPYPTSVARELIPIGKKTKEGSGESAESALLSHDIIKNMK